MITKYYKMTFPQWAAPGRPDLNRIAVIKALRQLTGLALKEAKDMTDRSGDVQVRVVINDRPASDWCEFATAEQILVENLRVLRANDVILELCGRDGTILELRNIVTELIQKGDDEFAMALIEVIRRFS